MCAVVEAQHLSDVGVELLYMPYELAYVDALWLLKYICDIVLFLLSRVDGERGEKVKHHAIVKQLARHSPFGPSRVSPCRLMYGSLSICSLTILFQAYLLFGESKFE